MPYCESCGKPHSETAKFCSNCGTATPARGLLNENSIHQEEIKVQNLTSNEVPTLENNQIFNNNLFAIQKADSGKIGIINNLNEFVVSPKYDSIVYSESKDLYIVQFKGKTGVINIRDQWIFEPIWDHITTFQSYGLAFIYTRDKGSSDLNKRGLINDDGRIILEPEYHFIGSLYKNKYINVTTKNLKTGVIDINGHWLIKPIFDELGSIDEHGNVVACLDDKYGLLKYSDGEWIIKPSFEKIEDFINGYAIASVNDLFGIITLNGNWIAPPNFINIEGLNEFEFAVAQNVDSKFGVINLKGEWLVRPSFDNVQIINKKFGISLVHKDDFCGVIDLTGKWIIPLEIENYPYFISDELYTEPLVSKKFGYNKVAEVKINGKFGIIDDNGNFIIKADRLQSMMGINYEESEDEEWDEEKDDDELGKENISKNVSPIKPKDSAGIR